MSNTFDGFDSRLKKIDRSHARLARGYAAKVTNEGLIVFRPKRHRGGFPVRGLLMLVGGAFLLKGIILAHLGEATYEQRLAALSAGSIVERGGAYVMQVEPVTEFVASKLRPLLN